MKDEEIIIANAVLFVKKRLHGNASGHDWWHIYRVWKMSLYLAVRESANTFEVQLAALLHDIEDWKLKESNNEQAQGEVREWLISQKINDKIIFHVCKIIENMSFKGAGVNTQMHTLEGKVVQDADRLDAIGAIGIARAFAYGGNKGREMHNPDILPVMHKTFEEYKSKQSTTLNHFHEKLLLLKDLMNTDTAKKIAKERHQFLELFLEQFKSEWYGEK